MKIQTNEALNSESGHFRSVSNKQWNSLITVISWARKGIDLSEEHILKLTSSAEKLGSLAQSQMSLTALVLVSELVPWYNATLQDVAQQQDEL